MNETDESLQLQYANMQKVALSEQQYWNEAMKRRVHPSDNNVNVASLVEGFCQHKIEPFTSLH